MTDAEFSALRTEQIKATIADLRRQREPLANGTLRVGDRPELAVDSTEARILDIDRKIAEQEALLRLYGESGSLS